MTTQMYRRDLWWVSRVSFLTNQRRKYAKEAY